MKAKYISHNCKTKPCQHHDDSDWISRQNNGGADNQHRDRESKILSASDPRGFKRDEHKHQ
jgi:hypothetical protein